ncbi:venom serine protease 34-like [Leptopilina heterotoma]|uniref:venom serine protease 34-like n=1 Tax=Leptopilina heterotoma TaxID=63436 RepID=UPI001CA7EF2D|nr:venom serine protease 34-like [Leptopilina heterotoma]
MIHQGAKNTYNLGISLKLCYFLFIFFLLLEVSKAQDTDCNFFTEIALGQTYFVYNPPYPNFSVGPQYCRFRAVCPPGSRILLNCIDIIIPTSLLCASQHLSIYTNPSNPLNLPLLFCGNGTLDVQSVGSFMTVIFRIFPRGTEARFTCTMSLI